MFSKSTMIPLSKVHTKFIIMTSKRYQRRRFCIFITNFEEISNFYLSTPQGESNHLQFNNCYLYGSIGLRHRTSYYYGMGSVIITSTKLFIDTFFQDLKMKMNFQVTFYCILKRTIRCLTRKDV